MRPVVTDGVALSVGLSVTTASCAKATEPFKVLTRVGRGPRNDYYMGSRSPHVKGKF